MALFDVPNYQSYYDAADAKLEEYYKTLLDQENNDVERVKRRLEEDYAKGTRITTEDYVSNIAFGQDKYKSDTANLADQSKQETRGLQTDTLNRGISQGGVADQLGGELKGRQDLRREAVDRALKKSEEDLSYTKERGLEDISTTKLRGGEDTAANFAKWQTQQARDREDRASALADSTYNREFNKRSTVASFKATEDAQKLAEEQWDWTKNR